jgi:hypothetical protein
MARLVDRFLRNEILASMPLHPNQHAHQSGKSVIALHHLVVQVEKVLDQQETALGIFLDREEAFNNTPYDSICAALAKHGVDCTIIQQTDQSYAGGSAGHREVSFHRSYDAFLLNG